MAGFPRARRPHPTNPPGLDTVEMSAIREHPEDAPPSPEAQSAGAYPTVIAGVASTLVGALMIVGSVLMIVDGLSLRATSDPLGPAAFPLGVGVLLGIVGIVLVVRNHRFVRVLLRVKRSPLGGRGRSALGILGLLVAFGIVLPFAGFFVSGVGLFVGSALLLGAPRRWQLILGGIVLSGLVVLLFDRVIGLSLPAGPWGF